MRILTLSKITPAMVGGALTAVNVNITPLTDFNKLLLTATDSNTGNLYIGLSNMNTTTYVGLMAIIPPGTTFVVGHESQSDAIRTSGLYLWSENGTETAFGFVMEQ